MVLTSVIKPSGILADYIRGFEFREINTLGEIMLKPIHAFHEALISIFISGESVPLNSVTVRSKDYTATKTSQSFSGVMGLHSSMKGTFHFSGYYKIFNIQFKPMGFTSIFKIPASVIMDKMYETGIVFNNDIKELHEQLNDCCCFVDMVHSAEKYLVKNLVKNKPKNSNHNLLKASNVLVNQPGAYSIEKLAYHTNMSLKTFERKFIDAVGLSPKLFVRIQRFNKALDLKTSQPALTWTSICHQVGYYDQNHFIKDFNAFAGLPPKAFFKNTPPPKEEFSFL